VRSNVEVEITPVEEEQFSVELDRPESSSSWPVGFSEAMTVVGRSPDVETPELPPDPAPATLDANQTIDALAPSLYVSPKRSGSSPVDEPNEVPETIDAKEEAASADGGGVPLDSAAVMKALGDSSVSDSGDDDSFLLAKPVVKIEEDPLKSDPNLVWYLRHKRLGEKGPLKASQVETMLESGQLRVGYIVWREDWNDWLPVEKVFPQLAVEPAESSYEIPDELNPHSEVSRKRRSKRRFWMCFIAAAFLIVILLVYWMTQFGW